MRRPDRTQLRRAVCAVFGHSSRWDGVEHISMDAHGDLIYSDFCMRCDENPRWHAPTRWRRFWQWARSHVTPAFMIGFVTALLLATICHL